MYINEKDFIFCFQNFNKMLNPKKFCLLFMSKKNNSIHSKRAINQERGSASESWGLRSSP